MFKLFGGQIFDVWFNFGYILRGGEEGGRRICRRGGEEYVEVSNSGLKFYLSTVRAESFSALWSQY